MSVLFSIILGVAVVALAAAAVIAVRGIVVGPSQLDRSINADLLVAVVIGGFGVWAVFTKQDVGIVGVLVLSMLGFTGAVAIARMVGERVVYRKPKPKEDAQ